MDLVWSEAHGIAVPSQEEYCANGRRSRLICAGEFAGVVPVSQL